TDTNRTHLLNPYSADPDPALVRKSAVTLLTRAGEVVSTDNPDDWPRFRLLTPHIRAVLDTSADYLEADDLAALVNLAARTSLAYHWMGTLSPAVELTNATLAKAALLGTDHDAFLFARRQGAYEARELGRWGEAEAAYREVLEAERRVLGEDHSYTL